MNLDSNGVVLTGADLERYSKRKGLCHLCARFATHKRAGKLWRRNRWNPLTIQNESTGDYIVYKGYCIQPTCYTLDQAKESLGEKPTTARRRSIPSVTVGLLGFAPLLGESAVTGKGRRHSSSAVNRGGPDASPSQRRASYQSSSYRRDSGGRWSPTGSVHSKAGSVSSARYKMSSNKWSRELPLIALPSFSQTGTGTGTPTEDGNPNDVDQDLAGAIANLTSVIYTSKHQRETPSHSKESQDTMSTAAKSIASGASRLTQEEKKSDGGSILKKSMGLFPGLKKGLRKSKSEDCTISSSASSLSSDSMTLDETSISHQHQLPGSGFVVNVAEGSYRAAFEALDLADGQGSHHRFQRLGDFKALCLQSKNMDYLDIEMVAVEVDAMNRHWMSKEFVLEDDDDVSTWDYDHELRVVQDLNSGIHAVRLSHVLCSGSEKLELEADLDDFESLERVRIEALERVRVDNNRDKASSEFLVFRTRVSLEAEIKSCRATIGEAERSDAPAAIQDGIDARNRLHMLLPLRKFYLSRKELEKKIRLLSQTIAALNGNDLDRRYYLATHREQLVSQFEEEKREEDRQRLKAEARKKRPEEASKPEMAEQLPSGCARDSDTVAAESILTGPQPLETPRNLVTQSKVADADRDSPNDGGVVVNMTVFQSAPLAYVDHTTGTHHVCPLLDFEYEGRALTQSLKDAETAGAKVDVEFDIATTDRLSAFLAKSESRVMHLSCHGHPNYLALENGFGGMQVLKVKDLKRFISSGAGNLEVVFVSACHSKAAGKAFLDAGIRHVICCRQDDKFRDEGSIEFARSFYRALAFNNTVKQAFKMAREAIRISPMVKDSKAEYEKFILLPELPSDDPYHDVHIFSNATNDSAAKRPVMGIRSEPRLKRKARILPRVPQYFVGREMNMYNILDALRNNDVVSIQGPPEIGKTSLVAAISRYIEQRHKSFLFDDVFWLPVQEGSIPPDDKLCLDLSRLFEMIKRAKNAPCQMDRGYADCWGRVIRQLHDKRMLIVVQGRGLTSYGSRASLEAFLRDLLRVSNAKIITVGVPVIEEAGPTTAIVDVEALDFDATVLLFARLTRSASVSTPQIIKSLTNLTSSKKKQDPSQEKLVAWRKRRTFERIGAGVPAAIRRAALDMSDEDLVDLLRIAKRPLVQVDSRSELEIKLTELEEDEGLELKKNMFLKARDIRETIEELQCLRQDFPNVYELEEEEKEVELALQRAISDKHYDDACHIKKNLAALQDQIAKELEHGRTREKLERLSSF